MDWKKTASKIQLASSMNDESCYQMTFNHLTPVHLTPVRHVRQREATTSQAQKLAMSKLSNVQLPGDKVSIRCSVGSKYLISHFPFSSCELSLLTARLWNGLGRVKFNEQHPSSVLFCWKLGNKNQKSSQLSHCPSATRGNQRFKLISESIDG